MSNKLPDEFISLGCYLWERINATDSEDTESLKVLGTITHVLIDKFNDDGFIRELNLWVGVKRDAPKDFKNLGEGLKHDFPEFFEVK